MANTTVTLTNIMANNGKGWVYSSKTNCTLQTSSHTPGDGAPGSLRVIPSATGECTLATPSKYLYPSHKYYLSFKIKFESQTSDTFDWYWPIAEPSAMNHASASGDANTWIRISTVFTRTSFAEGSYQCRWDYNNDSGNNVPVRYTSLMLFDLTAAFGAGNEPDKDWLDSYITTFGDTVSVVYPENIIWTPPDSNWEEKNGAHVSFTAPCDSSFTGRLKISSSNNTYSIVDACGNTINGKSGIFASGAVLDFILDCSNLKAYLQNQANNVDLSGYAKASAIPVIQCGTVSVSYGTSSSGTTTSVTFEQTFSTKPTVICQQVFDGNNCRIDPDQVTTSGFKIVTPQFSSSGTRKAMWIAIGT